MPRHNVDVVNLIRRTPTVVRPNARLPIPRRAPSALVVVAVALLVVAVDAHARGVARLTVACLVAGAILAAFALIVWLTAAYVGWNHEGGTWWRGRQQDADNLHVTWDVVRHCEAARERWARAAYATSVHLHADNVAVCRRLDRMAFLRAQRWNGEVLRRSDPTDLLTATWATLDEGSHKLAELCRELRSMAGRHLAPTAPTVAVPNSGVVDRLGELTVSLRALSAARAEVEPDKAARHPVAVSRLEDPTAGLVASVSAKAPGESRGVVEISRLLASEFAQVAAGERRLSEEIEQFPPEAPSAACEVYKSPRLALLKALKERREELRVALQAAAQAAEDLQPPPPPVPVPPLHIERAAVREADGMLRALRRSAGEDDDGQDVEKPPRRRRPYPRRASPGDADPRR